MEVEDEVLGIRISTALALSFLRKGVEKTLCFSQVVKWVITLFDNSAN